MKPIGPSALSRRATKVSVAFRSAPAQNDDAARAGEDHHARVVVGLEAQVGLVQGRGRGAVDGVAPVLGGRS